MRPLFIDFPTDPASYNVDDEYLFGSDLLVAPILEADKIERKIYLPASAVWRNAWTDQTYQGGQWISAEAPLETIPLFLRGDANLPIRTGY